MKAMQTTSFLQLAVGAVVVDVVFLLLNYERVVFKSDELTRWYTRFGPWAMAMDVAIIALVAHAGTRLTSGRNPWVSATTVVALQVAHDVCFATLFYGVPRGRHFLLDVFKDYANEVGVHAVWSDSLMMLGTLGVGALVRRARLSSENEAALLVAACYVALFACYTKKPVYK